MKPAGTIAEPFTHRHEGDDTTHKYCKCNKCRYIGLNTLGNDFYTLANDPSNVLHCEMCFGDHVRNVMREPIKQV
jgi:hypothetical protein